MRRATAPTLMLLLAAAAPAPTQETRPAGWKYALVVGVPEVAGKELPPLAYAAQDAAALAATLRKQDYRVVLLAPRGGKESPRDLPRLANLRAALNGLAGGRNPGDTVLVAFSGHLVQYDGDAEVYLAAADSAVATKERLLPLSEVYAALRDCRARVKVLLADGAREFTPPAGVKAGPARARPAPPEGVAALFASAPGGGSRESRNLRHGVFFYYVNKGLAGAAAEGRAGVTFAALRKYVEREVREHARAEFAADQAPALAGTAPAALLASAGGAAAAGSESLVVLETSLGEIVIELYRDRAPLSSANFLTYVDEGFYDGTIVHRTIPNFVIQGGGFLPGMKEKPARAGVKNEAGAGLSNRRGTVAVARAHAPDSGTCQFYINLKDNPSLDGGNAPGQAGYAVFGRVVEGMDVVDRIAGVETVGRAGHHDVPAQDVVIRSARRAAAR